jgi:AraC family ethanolamine operon transcriptional activator
VLRPSPQKTILPGSERPQPAGFYSALRTRDFDELAQAMLRWDSRFRQLGRGPFRGEIQLLRLGGIQIFRIAVNRKIHAQGLPPPDSFGCAPVLPANAAAVWRGRQFKVGQTRLIVPHFEMDHVTGDNYQVVVLTLDGGLVRQAAPLLGGFDVERRLAGKDAAAADPAGGRALWAHLVGLLDLAETTPALLTRADAAQQLEQECLRRFLAVVGQEDASWDAMATSTRTRLVQRAEEFMETSLAEPLTILALCREMGVSERTLHYAFQEVRRLSPMACFKAKRLNAVRRDLKEADDAATVHEIAQRWGFWHTGEFAADYRRLFGELPQQVLGQVTKGSGATAAPCAPRSAGRVSPP